MDAIKNKKKEKQKEKDYAISAVKLVISLVKEKSATGVQIQTLKEEVKKSENIESVKSFSTTLNFGNQNLKFKI
jgi:hypothetical protein